MMGQGKLDGRVAIVTGAAAGMGQAAAVALAAAGADVTLADVADCGETARRITELGRRALTVKCDVKLSADVRSMVDQTLETFGKLDCAFNNAGTAGVGDQVLHEADEDDWDDILATNLKGMWLCMKYELPPMLAQGRGSIVNGASGGAMIAVPKNGAYIASKHAILGITKTAALEYATQGVRVNALCAGPTRTAFMQRFLPVLPDGTQPDESLYTVMVPMGRMADPAEIAHSVVWLCSDESAFMTGHGFVIDGGMLAR
jgi:NAD(P)-dependent dehydrogenase (short-subunit alcohol dehydrogenase family)